MTDIGVSPEMIAALISGIVGGLVGGARAHSQGTKSSLEKGQNAFNDIRTENRDVRDRVAKLEGKLELALGLGLVRPPQSQTPEQ